VLRPGSSCLCSVASSLNSYPPHSTIGCDGYLGKAGVVTDSSQSKNRDVAVRTSRMFLHVSHKLGVIVLLASPNRTLDNGRRGLGRARLPAYGFSSFVGLPCAATALDGSGVVEWTESE
jgi:hypothetical protein